MFRLELVVLDPEDAKKHGAFADVGFDLRTATEAQTLTAARMLRSIADKLEKKMALTKHGAAEKIEAEPTDTAKTAAQEAWTDQDAAALAAENEGDDTSS